MNQDQQAIIAVLQDWAKATKEGRQNDVLANHLNDLVIYDVLPPMKYDSAESYRASWDDWQPDSQGEMLFELQDLSVTASQDTGFAFGLLRCGGALPSGETFSDTVRITFCLVKTDGQWKVAHQHVSKPFSSS